MKNNSVESVDFLFEYEVRNRELDSICLIGAYLESKGYTIGFVNSWDSLFNNPPMYDAKVMVISACYNDGTYDYFCSHAYKFDKVVNMQWEQVLCNSVVYSKEPSSWDYSGDALNTRHICWGINEKEYLVNRFQFDPDRLEICGYIPLDFYRKEFRNTTPDRKSLFEKYGLDSKKKTILFVSSFTWIGLPKSEEAIGDEEQKNKERQLHIDSQAEILDWFIRYLKENEDVQIIYRPHPAEAKNEKLRELSNVIDNFYVIPDEGIRNWIINCDILCNWQSTSMIEMFVSEKPVYLLRPVKIPFDLEMPIFDEKRIEPIESYEGFNRALLGNNQKTFPIPEVDVLQFYDINDEPVYKRIGDYLIKTLKDDKYHSRKVNKTIFDIDSEYRRVRRNIGAKIMTIVNLVFSNGEKITMNNLNEKIAHNNYFIAKMKQNGVSGKELHDKIKLYKSIIEKSDY